MRVPWWNWLLWLKLNCKGLQCKHIFQFLESLHQNNFWSFLSHNLHFWRFCLYYNHKKGYTLQFWYYWLHINVQTGNLPAFLVLVIWDVTLLMAACFIVDFNTGIFVTRIFPILSPCHPTCSLDFGVGRDRQKHGWTDRSS